MNSIKINVGFTTFAFRDENGDTFASLKINPTDPRLHARCKEIAQYFADIAAGKNKDVTSKAAQEKALQDKFCAFLGYDCRESLFGWVAATSEMADGRMFATHVLDTLAQHIGAEISKRRQANIQRYTKKYL